MKLNWFCPLPPARSGVAQYSAVILPYLHKWAELVLWTDQTDWDRTLEQCGQVRQFRPPHLPWPDVSRADMTIYHMGNNAIFHDSIWQVARLHPGIVVLHDLRLHDLFSYLYRHHRADREGYLAHMQAYYGEEGRLAGEIYWDGGHSADWMSENYPLTALALENALGVILHSPADCEEIRGQSSCPVALLDFPYASRGSSILESWKSRRVEASRPPYRLVIFGYLNPNRRLESVLQALANLPERDQFRLDVYGPLWNAEHVEDAIRSAGLTQQVHLHGFTPPAEIDVVLCQADLVINLRYPTMGEASLSQLQIWEHALPALVTEVGWYASLPKEAVAFVRPDNEVADIQNHLKAFLADPQRFTALGAEGCRVLQEKHPPERYAQSMIEFTARARAYRTHAVALEMADRVGAEVNRWTHPTVAEDLLDRVTQAIYSVTHGRLGAGMAHKP